MPAIAEPKPRVVTPDNNTLSHADHGKLTAAVRETFGADAPRECYAIALEFFDDELRHQRMLRAIDGYKRPLDRAQALADAIDAIKAC